eukprot:CAMPEP_0117581572 /NCGR_PEP_ID=MMETSP0784-20121206/65907_1 /TAXON_ID=39447 /ORGANISM="" /LENGTH=74 /DNA_ID=CAMNT_0005381909 /DNA_START=75 /DNA_END=299 /DNA_ORIENTATION=-
MPTFAPSGANGTRPEIESLERFMLKPSLKLCARRGVEVSKDRRRGDLHDDEEESAVKKSKLEPACTHASSLGHV